MTAPTFVASFEGTPWTTFTNKVTVPSEVQEGDLGFLIVGRDDGNGISIPTPAGWTILHSQVATNSSWRIYSKIYTPDDGDQYNVQYSAGMTTYAFWYRNAVLGPVGTAQKRSTTVTTIVCPQLNRTNSKSILLAIGCDRSINSTEGEKGYASVANATYVDNSDGNPTLGVGTHITQVWLSQIGQSAAAATVTWTLNDSSGNAFGIQIELFPVEQLVSRADAELLRLQDSTGLDLPYTLADLTLTELKGIVSDPTGQLKTIRDYKEEKESCTFDDTFNSDKGYYAQYGSYTVAGGIFKLGTTAGQHTSHIDAGLSGAEELTLFSRMKQDSNGLGGGVDWFVDLSTGARYSVWLYPTAGGASNKGKVGLLKFSNWTAYSTLATSDMDIADSWHDLKVTHDGNLIKVWVDGVLKITYTDGTPLTKGPGLALQNYVIAAPDNTEYEYLKVKQA